MQPFSDPNSTPKPSARELAGHDHPFLALLTLARPLWLYQGYRLAIAYDCTMRTYQSFSIQAISRNTICYSLTIIVLPFLHLTLIPVILHLLSSEGVTSTRRTPQVIPEPLLNMFRVERMRTRQPQRVLQVIYADCALWFLAIGSCWGLIRRLLMLRWRGSFPFLRCLRHREGILLDGRAENGKRM